MVPGVEAVKGVAGETPFAHACGHSLYADLLACTTTCRAFVRGSLRCRVYSPRSFPFLSFSFTSRGVVVPNKERGEIFLELLGLEGPFVDGVYYNLRYAAAGGLRVAAISRRWNDFLSHICEWKLFSFAPQLEKARRARALVLCGGSIHKIRKICEMMF